MIFRLKNDFFGNPVPPRTYLCTPSGKILGELFAYDIQGDFKWGQYSEITLSVDETYIDLITGESKINPLFSKIESLRQVLLEDIGYFTIQDVDTKYGDKNSKTITLFSFEYSSLGSKWMILSVISRAAGR